MLRSLFLNAQKPESNCDDKTCFWLHRLVANSETHRLGITSSFHVRAAAISSMVILMKTAIPRDEQVRMSSDTSMQSYLKKFLP